MKKLARFFLIFALIFLPLTTPLSAFAQKTPSNSPLQIAKQDGEPDDDDDEPDATEEVPFKELDDTGGEEGQYCDSIFGLMAWNCHVNLNAINNEGGNGTQKLSEAIWTIASNIAVDLTIVAAYAVLGYVIYGGYLYMFASGDPGKVAAGKKTLSQAFIGLAIVLSANVIVNAIRIGLHVNFANNCARVASAPDEASGCYRILNSGQLVTYAIQWLVGIGGLVALIFVVYGAISYITSAGDPAKVTKAKNTIVYSLIGLAIVAVAEIGTAFVSNLISNSLGTTTAPADPTSEEPPK